MRVDLICLGGKGEHPRHEISDGIDIWRLPLRRIRGSMLRYVFQYAAFLLISGAILAMRSVTRGYDLVYVHNMPDILVFSGLIPKLFGAKVILDFHDPMPELMMTIFSLGREASAVRFLRRLEKWSVAFADSVVIANHAFERILASRSCPSQKISVIMNSADEQVFPFRPPRSRATPTDALGDTFRIMYHGTLVERNGLHLAVEALARVRRSVPQAVLRIYGWSTPYLERVMDSIRSEGLQEAVQYLGPRLVEQLVQAIEECDLGIIPNARNAFTELNTPTRIFEYLTLGKPAIAPRAAGICDYFDDASLLFFELGNAEDLAEKIEYAFFHPAEVAETTRRGQEVCRAHSWRQQRLRLLALVSGLLGGEVTRVDPTSLARH
jgi:glycosyltransferase involved in cell wall biosynthesis